LSPPICRSVIYLWWWWLHVSHVCSLLIYSLLVKELKIKIKILGLKTRHVSHLEPPSPVLYTPPHIPSRSERILAIQPNSEWIRPNSEWIWPNSDQILTIPTKPHSHQSLCKFTVLYSPHVVWLDSSQTTMLEIGGGYELGVTAGYQFHSISLFHTSI
jgi:hypothetical protein